MAGCLPSQDKEKSGNSLYPGKVGAMLWNLDEKWGNFPCDQQIIEEVT